MSIQVLCSLKRIFKILFIFNSCVWLVTQLCPTLWDPMGCSPPGSSMHGILQARILKWVAFPFSRESSQPKDQTQVSCIAGGFCTTRKSQEYWSGLPYPSPGNLPNPRIKTRSPALQAGSLPFELPGKPIFNLILMNLCIFGCTGCVLLHAGKWRLLSVAVRRFSVVASLLLAHGL